MTNNSIHSATEYTPVNREQELDYWRYETHARVIDRGRDPHENRKFKKKDLGTTPTLEIKLNPRKCKHYSN